MSLDRTTLYRRLVWPLLARTDPESAHERTLRLLERAQRLAPGRLLLRWLAGPLPPRPVEVLGLRFPNPLGVAAGFDKDARVVRALAALGFGHVEVGTLTPRPQEGNPRPRLFRLPEDRALINRLGFPNGGVEAAVARLRRLAEKDPGTRRVVVGVSLGKQKETPLAEAVEDYRTCLRAVYPWGDYLAVNVSSPNTPGLRELQGGRYLERLLTDLVREAQELAQSHGVTPRPLLVKIAPDLTVPELETILTAVDAAGVDGLVATNTTVTREGLSPHGGAEAPARETGGLSGRPLEAQATEVVARVRELTGGRLPVIGVGGVEDAAGARRKLDAGASLVQLYTGLVYQGPGLAGEIVRGLSGASGEAPETFHPNLA